MRYRIRTVILLAGVLASIFVAGCFYSHTVKEQKEPVVAVPPTSSQTTTTVVPV